MKTDSVRHALVVIVYCFLAFSSQAGDWWAPGLGWNQAESGAFALDTRSARSAVEDSTGFALDTRGGQGMSSSGVADAFPLDTRTARTELVTITGPSAVSADSVQTYTATATYANGAVADVSSECQWRLEGAAAAAGAEMWGNKLMAGNPPAPVSGLIRATYPRPEGAIAAAPLVVAISKGFSIKLNKIQIAYAVDGWEMTANVTPSGGSGSISYQWYLNGYHLSSAANWVLSYPVNGSPGTRRLRVSAMDADGHNAVVECDVVFNKPPVPYQPPIQNPVRDPVGGDILDASGGQFVFQTDRIENGLVIVTHGLWSAGTEEWLQNLATNIDKRLRLEYRDRPNICIFDWEEQADPGELKDSLDFYLKYVPPALPAVSINIFIGIMAIHANAVAEGKALANWIHNEIQAGHISATAPIHLIGHSAGGFVVGECAYRLKDKGIHSGLVQATTLDTPYPIIYPGDTKVYHMSLGAPLVSRIDRYHARFPLGLGWIPGSLAAVGSGPGVYERSIWKWFVLDGHTMVREWYDENTTGFGSDHEQDGFYYSPFMDNGFPTISGGGNGAARLNMGDGPLPQGTTEESLTGFETFGTVAESAGLFTITEASNAGIFQDAVWPVGAQSVTFQYRFATPGDGDYLVVYGDTNGTPLFLGADLELSRGEFIDGEAPVVVYGGTTNRLTFMLVSRGETNAVVEIKDIQLVMSDDPDGDGMTSTEESALGTDPLLADTDGDGLSDFDEVNTHFTKPLLADSDGDGLKDALEIMASTNPNDPNSTLEIAKQEPLPNGGVAVFWQGVAGRTYKVNRTADLLGYGYETIASGVPGVAPYTTIQDTNAVSQAFYWVVVEAE